MQTLVNKFDLSAFYNQQNLVIDTTVCYILPLLINISENKFRIGEF